MQTTILTNAQRDAIERLNEAIVDRVLDHQAIARNQIVVAAAHAFLTLQEQGKVALSQDRVYFDPSVDVQKLAGVVFDQILSGTLPANEQAQALATAFAREQQRAKELRQRERDQRLLDDIVTTIGVLYGPQEVSDPHALASQILEHDAGELANDLEAAKIRALAPLVTAFVAEHQQVQSQSQSGPSNTPAH